MTHDSGGGGGGGSVGSTNNGSGNSTNNTSDRVDPHGDNTGISDANRVTVSDAALQGYEVSFYHFCFFFFCFKVKRFDSMTKTRKNNFSFPYAFCSQIYIFSSPRNIFIKSQCL